MKFKISSKDTLRLSLVVLAFLAVFVCFTGNSAAATINVGSGAGNDSATIQGGINAAVANDDIVVHHNPNNYTEQVYVDKAGLKIKRATGEDVTVQTTGSNTVFTIGGVSNVAIDGFRIQGNTKTMGYGIIAQFTTNNLTIINNVIVNRALGIAIAGSNATIKNNTFIDTSTGISQTFGTFQNWTISDNNINNANVGIVAPTIGDITISNNKISTIEGTSFSQSYGIDVSLNTAIANQNNQIFNNTITGASTTNTYNTGIRLQGSNVLTNPNTQIYSNNISNNYRGIKISNYRLDNGIGTTDIYLNRLYSNLLGISFQNTVIGATNSGTINAINNWWGKNTEPTLSTESAEPTTAVDIWKLNGAGTLNYNPWIVLNINANPNTINNGETSTITADLTKNSNNEDTTLIYPGKYVPDGITANFSSDAKGNVNPSSNTTTNGAATTTFTGNSPGIATVSAIIDGQTVNTNVNINPSADIAVSKDFFYEDLGTIIFPENPLDRYWKFFSEVVVTNNGPDTATNIKITDLLSSGLQLAPFDPFGSWFVTYTGQDPDLDPPENNPSFDPVTMIWTIPVMNNGDVWVLDFFTIADTTGIVNNTAIFDPTTADQYDPNSTNNVGFVETYVPTAQTQLTKWFQNDSTYGSPHTTTAYYHDNLYAFIKLYNIGPDTAKYITIIDDFTNDLIYNSALMETSYDGGLTWANDPNAFWLDFGTYFELEWFTNDIPFNGTALFRIPGQVNVSNTTITNTATESQRTFNPDGNNTDNPGFNTINGTTTLNIPRTPTALVVNPASGFKGDIVNLVATLTDTHNNVPLSGKTVNFFINGIRVASVFTNQSGVASFAYTITQNFGTYTILAQFLQNTIYAESTNTNNLQVARTPTAMVVNPASGFKGDIVNLVATLTNTHNNIPLSGKTVNFSVNGNYVGSVFTNPSGVASFAYTITQNFGTYTILGQFLQDATYAASSNTNSLNVLDVTPPIVVSSDPVNNAVNVPVNKIIKITFNEPIKAGTAFNSITVKNAAGWAAGITKTISGNVLSIALSHGTYLPGNKFIINLPVNSIADIAGNELAQTYTSNFIIKTIPLAVTTTDPVNNAINVATNKVIKITFNEPVQILGTNPWIELKSSTGKPIAVNWSISGNVLSVTPAYLLSKTTQYILTLHANCIADLSGQGLTPSYTTRFTTTTV